MPRDPKISCVSSGSSGSRESEMTPESPDEAGAQMDIERSIRSPTTRLWMRDRSTATGHQGAYWRSEGREGQPPKLSSRPTQENGVSSERSPFPVVHCKEQ